MPEQPVDEHDITAGGVRVQISKSAASPAQDDSWAEDMMDDVPETSALSVEERKQHRAAMAGILPDDVLDGIYGADSR